MTLKASTIAAFLDAELGGADITVAAPASLPSIAANRVVFVNGASPALLQQLQPDTLAIVPKHVAVKGSSYIAVDDPRLAFARVLEKFFAKPKSEEMISPLASIAPSARLGKDVRVGAFSVIGAGAVIGDGTEIRTHVVIAAGVTIGSHCMIKSQSVIGEEGFGIAKDARWQNVRVPQVGSVVIGDRVEIGALNTVACGTLDNTVIGDDSKFDDHVHVAHNVRIGRNCIITACAEISGSVTIGDHVWLGPNCSIINGITIGDGALIGIGAVITKPVAANAVMGAARATLLRAAD